jgi:hypothetical protein
MTHQEAVTLAKALRLLDDQPRFGPRDRRLQFDSYSVAADIEATLRAAGYDPRNPHLLAV